MKLNISIILAILVIAIIFVLPQSAVAQLDTSATHVLRDTVNGWYYVGHVSGLTLDTAYTYLDGRDKVQGRSSQVWHVGVLHNPKSDTAIVWEKVLNPPHLVPDSAIWFMKVVSGLSPAVSFITIDTAGQEHIVWGTSALNDWLQRREGNRAVGGEKPNVVKLRIAIGLFSTGNNAPVEFKLDSLVFEDQEWPNPYPSIDNFEMPPHLVLNQSSLDFGNAMLGCNVTLPLIAKRADFSPLDLNATVTNTNPAFRVSTSGFRLPTHRDSQTVAVSFAPTDTGTQTGMLIFTHDGDNSPDTVTISAYGGAIPDSAVLIRPPVGTDWQLVSLPGPVAPGACPPNYHPLYGYDNGYREVDSMVLGMGYWYKVSVPPQFVVQSYENFTVNVNTNWNLIGSSTTPIPVAQMGSAPPHVITSYFFGFDGNTYVKADTIQPGQAYWVKVGQASQLTYTPSSNALAKAGDNRIRIIDDGDLPPPPPGGYKHPVPTPVTPTAYALTQNYPNPFNPSTTIEYSLPSPGNVTLKVYNVLGQEVATLVNEAKEPGTYTVQWNASRVPSGLYFYQLQSGSYRNTQKMLLLK